MSPIVDTLAKPHWRARFQGNPAAAALDMAVRRGCCVVATLMKRLAREARMQRWSGERGASVVEALGKTITETRELVHELRLLAQQQATLAPVAGLTSRPPAADGGVRVERGARLVPPEFLGTKGATA